MKKLLFVLPIVLLLAAGCNSSQPVVEQNQQTNTSQTPQQITQSPTPTPIQANTANTSQQTYQDDRVQVSAPSDWVKATATVKVTGSSSFDLPIGLKFTKDNYTLSLLTHHGQASGIQGGRLSEISSAALNLNTGIIDDCAGYIKSNSTKINEFLNRADLYIDTNHISNSVLADCGIKSHNGVVWLGSFFSQKSGGYFLDYPSLAGIKYPFLCGTNCEMAFGIKINNASASNLPKQGDQQLNQYLNDASNIVKNITYKTTVAKPDIFDSLKALSNYPAWVGTTGNTQVLLTCDGTQGKMFLNVVDMESLIDVNSLYSQVGQIAIANGYKKCNTSQDSSKTTDAYQKGNQLMNVELDNKGVYIDVLFDSQTDYINKQ